MAITAAHRWYAGAAATSVGVLAVGYFLLVSPQQSNASDITTQTGAVESANVAAQGQIDALKAQYPDLPQLQAQVAAIRARIPQSPQEPALLRSISALAKSSGVSLVSVQAQAPTPVGGPVAGSTATAGSAVSQIPLTIEVTGSFANTRLFLNGIESMRRSMLVTGLDVSRQGESADAAATASSVNVIRTVVSARIFMASASAVPAVSGVTAAGTGTTTNQPS